MKKFFSKKNKNKSSSSVDVSADPPTAQETLASASSNPSISVSSTNQDGGGRNAYAYPSLNEANLKGLAKAVWREDFQKAKDESIKKKSHINDVDPNKRTAMHLACVKHNIAIIQILLGAGPKLDLQDKDGATALIKAAQCCPNATSPNADSIIKLLLSASASVDIQDNQGWSALHYAAEAGNSSAIKSLLNKKAEPLLKSNAGDTPLHIAAINDQVACCRALDIIPVDETNKNKRTPLMLATLSNSHETVEYLLECGADTSLKDDSGMTALEMARAKGNTELAQLLASRGATEDTVEAFAPVSQTEDSVDATADGDENPRPVEAAKRDVEDSWNDTPESSPKPRPRAANQSDSKDRTVEDSSLLDIPEIFGVKSEEDRSARSVAVSEISSAKLTDKLSPRASPVKSTGGADLAKQTSEDLSSFADDSSFSLNLHAKPRNTSTLKADQILKGDREESPDTDDNCSDIEDAAVLDGTGEIDNKEAMVSPHAAVATKPVVGKKIEDEYDSDTENQFSLALSATKPKNSASLETHLETGGEATPESPLVTAEKSSPNKEDEWDSVSEFTVGLKAKKPNQKSDPPSEGLKWDSDTEVSSKKKDDTVPNAAAPRVNNSAQEKPSLKSDNILDDIIQEATENCPDVLSMKTEANEPSSKWDSSDDEAGEPLDGAPEIIPTVQDDKKPTQEVDVDSDFDSDSDPEAAKPADPVVRKDLDDLNATGTTGRTGGWESESMMSSSNDVNEGRQGAYTTGTSTGYTTGTTAYTTETESDSSEESPVEKTEKSSATVVNALIGVKLAGSEVPAPPKAEVEAMEDEESEAEEETISSWEIENRQKKLLNTAPNKLEQPADSIAEDVTEDQVNEPVSENRELYAAVGSNDSLFQPDDDKPRNGILHSGKDNTAVPTVSVNSESSQMKPAPESSSDDDDFGGASISHSASAAAPLFEAYKKDGSPSKMVALQSQFREQSLLIAQEQAEKKQFETRLKNFEAEVDQLNSKIQNLKREHEVSEEEKMKLKNQLQNLQYQLSEESDQRLSTEQSLAQKQAQLAALELELDQAVEEKERLESQLRQLQQQLREANLKLKNATLQSPRSRMGRSTPRGGMSESHHGGDETLDDIQEEISLQKSVDTKTLQSAPTSLQKPKSEEMLSQLDSQLGSFTKEIGDLKAEKQRLEEELQSEKEDNGKRVKELEAQLAEKERAFHDLEMKGVNLQQQLDEKESQVRRLEDDLERKMKEITQLQLSIQQLSIENAKLAANLDAADSVSKAKLEKYEDMLKMASDNVEKLQKKLDDQSESFATRLAEASRAAAPPADSSANETAEQLRQQEQLLAETRQNLAVAQARLEANQEAKAASDAERERLKQEMETMREKLGGDWPEKATLDAMSKEQLEERSRQRELTSKIGALEAQNSAPQLQDDEQKANAREVEGRVSENRILWENEAKSKTELAKKLARMEEAHKELEKELAAERSKNNTFTSSAPRHPITEESAQLISPMRLTSENLDGLHNDLEKERQARHSLDETNRSLASEKDQLKSQLDQSRTSALSPEDLDAYRKEIEARCRLELNEKLAQVNRYLDEQNLTRSSLEKFRAENENLLKRDYNRRISDLELEIRKYKELYGVSIPVRDRPAALESDPELKRLQALLEKERRQREKLESRLDRIIDRKIDTSHLPQDRTRTLDLARGSLHSTGGLRSGTEYENLLEKVRRQLDNSISRHLGTTKLELEIYSQNPYASWDRSLSGKR